MFPILAQATDTAVNVGDQLADTAKGAGTALRTSFENAWTQIVDYTLRYGRDCRAGGWLLCGQDRGPRCHGIVRTSRLAEGR